jgi:hypothetical protein
LSHLLGQRRSDDWPLATASRCSGKVTNGPVYRRCVLRHAACGRETAGVPHAF